MDDPARGSGEQTSGDHRRSIRLIYASAEDARRDRLSDVTRGMLARSAVPLRSGEIVDVRVEVVRERAGASARGLVRWATPLASGSLVGLDLEGVEHRDSVKLDLILGIRGAGAFDEATAIEGSFAEADRQEAPPLSVTMLQPNPVLRQALQNALEKFAAEKAGGAPLKLESAADVPSFVASLSARRPDLAIIDCDVAESAPDPIMDAVRSNAPTRRTPVILLASARSPHLEDRYTVTMRKPLATKAFLEAADILLRS